MTEPATVVTEEPKPLLAGTFALYDDLNGGYVLVTETPDHGIVKKSIPGMLVKLMRGGPIGKFFGGGQ